MVTPQYRYGLFSQSLYKGGYPPGRSKLEAHGAEAHYIGVIVPDKFLYDLLYLFPPQDEVCNGYLMARDITGQGGHGKVGGPPPPGGKGGGGGRPWLVLFFSPRFCLMVGGVFSPPPRLTS